MKTLLFLVVTVIAGILLGSIWAFTQYPSAPTLQTEATASHGQKATPTADAKNPSVSQNTGLTTTDNKEKVPQFKVDKATHDFGTMEDSKKGHHEFVIENTGSASLTLKVASTTCKCTKGELGKEKLYPGEKTKLVLEWDPKGYTGKFTQTANLTTNDPQHPSVDLKVKGRVHAPIAFVPRIMIFGQITSRQDTEGTVRLYLFKDENAKIIDVKLKKKRTASFFNVDLEKLTPEEVKEQPDAKAGYQINVTLKPGMEQGPINQTVLIKTDSKTLGSIDLPIEGKVVGGISIYGKGWDDSRNIVRLGVVNGKRGLKQSLTVVLRNVIGQSEAEKLRITSVTPSKYLKASLSDQKTGSSGKITHARLNLEIPPGTPAVNFIGSRQASFGRVLIESDRPNGPKLNLRVSFVVETP